MKFIAVSILCILLLSQSFSKWLVLLDYTINKEFIAKNLCVNRARPKMHCNGHCQLMKRMAEEEKQNNPAGQGKTHFDEITINKEVVSLPANREVAAPCVYPIYLSPYNKLMFAASIFHPPKA